MTLKDYLDDELKQDILRCNKLNQLGKYNFCSLKVRTNWNWDLDKLENWLFDYEDNMLVNYLRYDFAISHFDLRGS